ncbi:MAG: L,D-transpeptidase [Mesorhizobium sp.]|uniref:L,D-transpeptidase family protein n=1 Tax=unclassified Mesorhizobium TaxID=325217 RepID=UPI000FCB21DC|nr:MULTISPECIES: L,D-transpeptidase [unclassified Mesorhizobium]RUV66883.1 L,D-transpeptidase [Mesorhizobium sp. M5C.F.Cr.IN.023.01.1.1]RWF86396.1 MAG: L,D-transpeptidase [Mesorhizobium sp.]RWF90858.1 MAG: L,D-transpeptidase [Mesorhizobium sp.]RWI32669.1 MAG: L,D-transpeptidase [Mesorhizobium sp.]RWI43805.1 MAG: L,D-transpeptidase [Mesorhizobium sp.]
MICSVARSYKKKRACNEASAFLRKGLRVLTVRARPGHASQGLLQAGKLVFSCALGRGGISAGKREGDGATPLGSMRVLSGYFRNDHFSGGRKTRLAMTPIGRDLGWCEVPEDRNYNRPVKIPYGASHERMLRTDRLYDACLVLDWNISPRRRGRGSAIFFHLARPGFTPTQGCVAVTARTMARLLPLLSDRTVMKVVR